MARPRRSPSTEPLVLPGRELASPSRPGRPAPSTPLQSGHPPTPDENSSVLVNQTLGVDDNLPPSSPPSDQSSSLPTSPTVAAVRRAKKGKGRAKPLTSRNRSVSPLILSPDIPLFRPLTDDPPQPAESSTASPGESRKRRRTTTATHDTGDATGTTLRSQTTPPEMRAFPIIDDRDSDIVMADRSTPRLRRVSVSSVPSSEGIRHSHPDRPPIPPPHLPQQMRHISYTTRPGIASPPPGSTHVPFEQMGPPPLPNALPVPERAPSTPPPPYPYPHHPPPPSSSPSETNGIPGQSEQHARASAFEQARRHLHLGPFLHGAPPPGIPLGAPHGVPLQVTRAPAGGWRRIQGDDHYWRIRGMDPQQLDAWTSDHGPAVLVQVPGVGAGDPGVFDRLAAIRDLLRTYFGMDNITITAAIPPSENARPNSEPFFNIIRGPDLSWDDVEELATIQWLSTPTLTVNFEPFVFEAPTFLGAWRHIERFGDASEAGIRRAFQRGLRSEVMRIGITRLLMNDIENDGLWAGYTVGDAYRAILESVEVRILPNRRAGHSNEPLALLYCLSPTAFPPEWILFRDHVQMYQYGSAHEGSPEFVTHHLWCSICHSTDHPTHHCYLPNVHGWFGPTHPPPRRTNQAQPPHRGPPNPRGRRGPGPDRRGRDTHRDDRGPSGSGIRR